MTPERIRAILHQLGLSQVAGAHLVGTDPRSMRRWCAGVGAISPTAERLLRLLEQAPELLPRLKAIAATPDEGGAHSLETSVG